jgi:cytochrome c
MKNLVKNLVQKNKKFAMDGMTYLAFAFCVAGFATIIADLFYQPKIVKKRGYEIEMALDGKPVAKKVEKVIDLAELMKIADIDRGAKIFKKCASCHNAGKDEGAKVGPGLYGVVGRAKGIFAGFSYSEAMKAKGGIWDRDAINQFITKPKDYLPGTKMAFAGLKKPQDRADVISYLEKQVK